MWTYNEMDFAEIYDFLINNPSIVYPSKLVENDKYQWSIEVSQETTFRQLPLQFEIIIKDENKRNQGRCDFNIFKNDICELINIDSDRTGLGSIMFYIMDNLIDQYEINLSKKINEICGILSNKHKLNGDWLKSIPFYCMKANKCFYSINFRFDIDEILYKSNLLDHDEQYKESYELAKYLTNTYSKGSFSIYRYGIQKNCT